MKRGVLALILMLSLLRPLCAMAFGIDSAERAMQAGQPEQALREVQDFQPTNQRDHIRKLWIMGVALNRLDRPRAAIAPLDRLVALAPAQVDFRLELALALQRAGQPDRARHHFTLAQGADLSPAIRARVQSEIDKIDTSRTWQGYVRFALVPETNAARRTAAETVSLGGLVFGLLPGARAQPATGVELGFGLAALPRLGTNLRAKVGIDVLGRVYDGRAPDDLTVRASAGLLQFGDRGRQLSAEVFTTNRRLDRAPYSRSLGLDLRHAARIGAKTHLTTTITRESLTYTLPRYSVDRTAVSLSLTRAATQQLHLTAAVRAEWRHSANQLAAGQAYGVSVGGQYSFAGGLRAGVSVSYDQNTFAGVHPLFGVQRQDRKLSAVVQVNNQNWSAFGFSPVLKLGVERQRSSIVVNSFRNLSASVGLTRSF